MRRGGGSAAAERARRGHNGPRRTAQGGPPQETADGSKTTPGRPRTPPRLRRSQGSQDLPTSSPRRPKTTASRPVKRPPPPQDGTRTPKTTQDGPKTCQETPKTTPDPRAPKTSPRHPRFCGRLGFFEGGPRGGWLKGRGAVGSRAGLRGPPGPARSRQKTQLFVNEKHRLLTKKQQLNKKSIFSFGRVNHFS